MNKQEQSPIDRTILVQAEFLKKHPEIKAEEWIRDHSEEARKILTENPNATPEDLEVTLH